MTYANDRIILLIDGPRANGVYLVDAPNDEATKTRLDDDAQDAATALRESDLDWSVNDVARSLEEKGWALSWLGLIEVAI